MTPGSRSRRGRAALLGLLLVSLAGAAGAASDPIAAQLASGGYNIFWRHAKAGAGMDIIRYTSDDAELADCARQRDLDAEGEADARTVGEGFRARGIPVSEVLASPYCRTLKTARLGFGAGRVTREDGLATVCQAPGRVFDDNTARLRVLLGTPPPSPGNRVLVSHNCNIRALAGLLSEQCAREPEQGDAVVFRPTTSGPGFEFVACLSLQQMRGWAATQ